MLRCCSFLDGRMLLLPPWVLSRSCLTTIGSDAGHTGTVIRLSLPVFSVCPQIMRFHINFCCLQPQQRSRKAVGCAIADTINLNCQLQFCNITFWGNLICATFGHRFWCFILYRCNKRVLPIWSSNVQWGAGNSINACGNTKVVRFSLSLDYYFDTKNLRFWVCCRLSPDYCHSSRLLIACWFLKFVLILGLPLLFSHLSQFATLNFMFINYKKLFRLMQTLIFTILNYNWVA